MWALILSSLIWSFSFGLIKQNLVGIDSWWVSTVRLGLSALLFLPFLGRFSSVRKQALRWMGVGALQFGLMYGAYTASFQFLAAYQVAALTTTTPLFVVLGGAYLERRWSLGNTGAAVFAILGSLVLVIKAPLSGLAIWGVVLIQFANLCFAAGQLLYRRWSGGPAAHTAQMGFAYIGAVIIAAAAWGLTSRTVSTQPLNVSAIGTLLYLGVVPTGIGFFIWNLGTKSVRTGVLAIMNNAKIPLGVLVSGVFFGERIEWMGLLASAALFGLAFGSLGMVSNRAK